MSAYVIGYLTDVRIGPDIFEYMGQVESTFEPFGGSWLVHGTDPQVLEGPLPGGIVIIEFPSTEAANGWYRSDHYQEILPLRTNNAESVVAIVAGVREGYRAAETIETLQGVPAI